MNPTLPFYSSEPAFDSKAYVNTKPDDFGYRFHAPAAMPVSVGWYYGSNEHELNLPKEIVTSAQGEYFAVGNNEIPNYAGVPLVNVFSPEYNYERAQSTIRLTRI